MNDDEKVAIERATAEAFLGLYNAQARGSFVVKECSDAPDIRCVDADGNSLNLEITLTEDRFGDIQARLGRSEAWSLESLKRHLADVRAGIANPMQRVSCLSGNVAAMAANRIQAKLAKDYGPNTALVVRDTSGVDWN